MPQYRTGQGTTFDDQNISYIKQNNLEKNNEDPNLSYAAQQQTDEGDQITPDNKVNLSNWDLDSDGDDKQQVQKVQQDNKSLKNQINKKGQYYNVLGRNTILKQQQNKLDQQQQKKQKVKEKEKEKQEEPKKRGNRNYNNNEQEKFIQRKNDDHQLPTDDSAPKTRGNRKRGQSSCPDENLDYGSRRPDYNSNNNRYGERNNNNNDRGGRYNNNYYRNNNYNNRGYETESSQRQTQTKNDQTTYKNNQYPNNRNSNYNGGGFKKKYNQRPYHNEGRNYNHSYRYNNNQKRQEPETIVKEIIKEVIKEVQVQKIKIVEKILQVQKPRPAGRRVQPEVSIYLRGCLLTLTCRRLEKFKAEILVMPFKTLKLQLYPGYLVNACEIDYKDKIKKKGEQMEKQGAVYLQRCVGIKDFQGFAFMKIGDPENSIKTGIVNLLETIQKINKKVTSIIFPISKNLGASKQVIKTLIEQIEKYKFLKDIYITTEQSKTFCEAVSAFNQIFSELFQDNEISIN